jgi:long-chain acyl-CoA synthetase
MGKVLILFPEGERSIDGELKPFRKGAAILAAHQDVPIVPVALDGLHEMWPRGRQLNWSALVPGRTRVRVAIGPPVRVERGAYAAGTACVEDAVRTAFAGMRRK